MVPSVGLIATVKVHCEAIFPVRVPNYKKRTEVVIISILPKNHADGDK